MSHAIRNVTSGIWCAAVVAATAWAAGGCSSEVKVREITGPPQEVLKPFDGVPIRPVARQSVEVYAHRGDGTYELVHGQHVDLPDQGHLYALRVNAGGLSNQTLALTMEPGGNPTKVSLKATSQGTAVLTQAGASFKDVTGAVAGFEDKRRSLAQAEEDARKQRQSDEAAGEAEREALATAYFEAREAVTVQQAVVDALKPADGVPKIVAETSKLRRLMAEANRAAKAAGKTQVPFPEVGRP